jgi:hypothetical protein
VENVLWLLVLPLLILGRGKISEFLFDAAQQEESNDRQFSAEHHCSLISPANSHILLSAGRLFHHLDSAHSRALHLKTQAIFPRQKSRMEEK